MKYCCDCGAELTGDIHVCHAVDNTPTVESAPSKKWSAMTIIAFILSIVAVIISGAFTVWNYTVADLGFLFVCFFCIAICFPVSIVSVTLSIVAVYITAKRKMRGKAFAIASLVMSAVSFCLFLSVFLYPLGLLISFHITNLT